MIGAMLLFVTTTYERAIRKLIAEDARERMEAQIVANPAGAPVIPGTEHVKKSGDTTKSSSFPRKSV